MHECHKAGGECDRQSGGYERSFAWFEVNVYARTQVPTSIARTAPLRKWHLWVHTLDKHLDDRLLGHAWTVASDDRPADRLVLHTRRMANAAPLYRERLLPGPAWWLVVAAVVAMIAIAYGAALGSGIGWIVGAGLVGIVAVGLVRSSPVIEVFDDRIRCGRANLPRDFALKSSIVEPDRMSVIRRGHDATVGDRVYLVVPAWFAKQGVLVDLADDVDPHSAWLIASRHPATLHEALSTRVAG